MRTPQFVEGAIKLTRLVDLLLRLVRVDFVIVKHRNWDRSGDE